MDIYRFLIAITLLTFSTVVSAQISINKSFSPESTYPTGESNLVIDVFNTASVDAVNVSLTDNLPTSPTGLEVGSSGLISNSCGGSVSATPGSQTINLSGGMVPAASGSVPGSCRIEVEITASPPSVPTTYENVIAASDVTSSLGSAAADAEATLSIFSPSNISVDKEVIDNYPIRGGGETRIGITLGNTNSFDITGINLTDPLKSPIVVADTPDIANSCNGTISATTDGNSVTLTNGSIAANSSCTFSFDVKVMGDGETYVDRFWNNTIEENTLASDQGATNDYERIFANANAGAELDKQFNPGVIGVNETSTVTITIGNRNVTDINNFGITDNLPSGLTAVNGSGSTTCGGAVNVAAGTVSLTGASLAGSVYGNSDDFTSSCTVTFDVTSDTEGQYTNIIPFGVLDGTNVEHNHTDDTLTVSSGSIGATKAFNDSSLPQTGRLIATINLTNTYSQPAVINSFVDDLTSMQIPGITIGASPAPTTDCGGVLTAIPGTTEVQLTGGSIPAGSSLTEPGSCSIEFPIRASADIYVGAAIRNIIRAGDIDTSLGTNGSDIVSSRVVTRDAINTGISWRDESRSQLISSAQANQVVSLDITLSRYRKAEQLSNVSFTNNLPSGFIIADTPNVTTSCSGGVVSAVPGATSFSLSAATMGASDFAPGDSCQIRVNVLTPASTGAYEAAIPSGSVSGESDVGTVYNTRDRDDEIFIIEGLGVSKAFNPTNIAVNGTSRVRVNISNSGANTINLTDVNITDELPAGMFLDGTGNPTASNCSGTFSALPDGEEISWTGDIDADQTCQLSFDVTTNVIGNLVNSILPGDVTSTEGFFNADRASATLTTSGESDLSVTKTNNIDSLAPGESSTYTIEVFNPSIYGVSGLPFEDLQPTGMTFDSWSCSGTSGSSCNDTSGTGDVVTELNIEPNGTITIVVQATLDNNYSQDEVTNTASINPGAIAIIDPDSSNNTASDTDAVNAVLTLVKQVDNTGGGSASASDWTLEASGTGGNFSGTTGDASITEVAVIPGTYTLSENGTVTDYTASEWSCTNGITVNSSVITLSNADQTVCTITNTFQPTAGISLDKTADILKYSSVGQVVTYTYTVTNIGNVDVSDVAVTDDKLGDITNCSPLTIAPTESSVCSEQYTIQETDLEGSPGSITNIATATGTPASGNLQPAEATLTITEMMLDITATNDDYSSAPVNGLDGGRVGIILNNDTLDGVAVDPDLIDLTITDNASVDISVDSEGNLSVSPGTPSGTYTLMYQICEQANPGNCDTAEVIVVVQAAEIVAEDDDYSSNPVNGYDGGDLGNIFENDTLNGESFEPNEVTFDIVDDAGSGIVVDENGNASIPAGTAAGTYEVTYQICEAINPDNCSEAVITVVVLPPEIIAEDDDFTDNPINGFVGGNAGNVLANDTLNGVAVDDTEITINIIDSSNANLNIDTNGQLLIPAGTPVDTYTLTYEICEVVNPTNCDTAEVIVEVIGAAQLRLIKSSSVKEVQLGDFVRYTVTVENVGNVDVYDAVLVDKPPMGFAFVQGSEQITDINSENDLVQSPYNPLTFEGVDVQVGQTASIEYMMRVGATALGNKHTNRIVGMLDGTVISNEATATVIMVSDPDFEQATIVGKVFNDRDEDGWQDDATATGIRVSGGLDESSYIANSTTVDRGDGPQPEADASAPLNHGIELGTLRGRKSVMDPAMNHQIVISQEMTEPNFTNDFVLTTNEGTKITMDAQGNISVERSGEVADELSAQDVRVERRITRVGDNYHVDYVISNYGIYEKGIPGVRVATVEGIIIETDAYGRFHLNAIDIKNFGRGQNFIMKVDPATIPVQSDFTTENPRVQRLTQGFLTRFDFGVKLPEPEEPPQDYLEELVVETFWFDDNSVEIKEKYRPVLQELAAKINTFKGANLVIDGYGGGTPIAFERAKVLRDALIELVKPKVVKNVKVTLNAEAADLVKGREVITLGEKVQIGQFFFDTDKSEILAKHQPVLESIANYLKEKGGGALWISGYTDIRASNEYNYRLGLRRADSVYRALRHYIDENLIKRVRIEVAPGQYEDSTGGASHE